jgi:hypothetical protein
LDYIEEPVSSGFGKRPPGGPLPGQKRPERRNQGFRQNKLFVK